MLKNRKGSTPLATTFLVLLIIMLVMITLFYFITHSSKVEKEIASGIELSKIYEKQKVVDFYVQDILDKSTKDVQSVDEFVSEAQRITSLYKDEFGNFIVPELSQIDNQLDGARIVGESIEVELVISIDDSFKRENEEIFSINYKYARNFISNI